MTDPKKRVLEHIKEDEVIELTKKLCSFPSYSGHETECTRFLGEFMSENGLEVEYQEVEPGRLQTIGRMNGAGEGASMMFNGHLDVGPVLMYTWTKKGPYEPYVRDGYIHGHGIENMKGGVAAMVAAAIALKRAGIELKGDLVVCAVVGELQGGVGTKFLVENGVVTDYALVPEPSGLTVRTATAGCAEFLIHTYGLDKRVDAFEKMVKAWRALKEASREKKFDYRYFPGKPELPRINFGGVIGGIGWEHSFLRCPPGAPEVCTMGIDVRTVPGQTEESVREDIVKALQAIKTEDDDFHFKVEGPPATYTDEWPIFKHFAPPSNLPQDSRMVTVAAENHELVTGEPCVVWTQPHQYAYNDCGHLQEAGIQATTYGPIFRNYEYTDGSREDSMEIHQIMTTAKVFAISAIDICNTNER